MSVFIAEGRKRPPHRYDMFFGGRVICCASIKHYVCSCHAVSIGRKRCKRICRNDRPLAMSNSLSVRGALYKFRQLLFSTNEQAADAV